MQLTNKEIIDYYESLTHLNQENISINLPAKISYIIIRNIKSLENIYQDIMKVRENILIEYGKEQISEDGIISYSIPQENMEIVSKELNSLFEVSNDVYILNIKIQDLDNCQIPLQMMNTLYFMIDNGEEN